MKEIKYFGLGERDISFRFRSFKFQEFEVDLCVDINKECNNIHISYLIWLKGEKIKDITKVAIGRFKDGEFETEFTPIYRSLNQSFKNDLEPMVIATMQVVKEKIEFEYNVRNIKLKRDLDTLEQQEEKKKDFIDWLKGV